MAILYDHTDKDTDLSRQLSPTDTPRISYSSNQRSLERQGEGSGGIGWRLRGRGRREAEAGEEGALRRGLEASFKYPLEKPMVGRPCDPQCIGETTYSRFSRRPTVGSFLGHLKALTWSLPHPRLSTHPLPPPKNSSPRHVRMTGRAIPELRRFPLSQGGTTARGIKQRDR